MNTSTPWMMVSALTAFIIAAGGAVMAVVGSGYDVNGKSWIIAGITGAMAGSKDLRSSMRMPPITISNDTAFVDKPKTKDP